jgi:hypothetical protein
MPALLARWLGVRCGVLLARGQEAVAAAAMPSSAIEASALADRTLNR